MVNCQLLEMLVWLNFAGSGWKIFLVRISRIVLELFRSSCKIEKRAKKWDDVADAVS